MTSYKEHHFHPHFICSVFGLNVKPLNIQCKRKSALCHMAFLKLYVRRLESGIQLLRNSSTSSSLQQMKRSRPRAAGMNSHHKDLHCNHVRLGGYLEGVISGVATSAVGSLKGNCETLMPLVSGTRCPFCAITS